LRLTRPPNDCNKDARLASSGFPDLLHVLSRRSRRGNRPSQWLPLPCKNVFGDSCGRLVSDRAIRSLRHRSRGCSQSVRLFRPGGFVSLHGTGGPHKGLKQCPSPLPGFPVRGFRLCRPEVFRKRSGMVYPPHPNPQSVPTRQLPGIAERAAMWWRSALDTEERDSDP